MTNKAKLETMLVREKSIYGKEKEEENAQVAYILIQKELKTCQKTSFKSMSRKTKVYIFWMIF